MFHKAYECLPFTIYIYSQLKLCHHRFWNLRPRPNRKDEFGTILKLAQFACTDEPQETAQVRVNETCALGEFAYGSEITGTRLKVISYRSFFHQIHLYNLSLRHITTCCEYTMHHHRDDHSCYIQSLELQLVVSLHVWKNNGDYKLPCCAFDGKQKRNTRRYALMSPTNLCGYMQN